MTSGTPVAPMPTTRLSPSVTSDVAVSHGRARCEASSPMKRSGLAGRSTSGAPSLQQAAEHCQAIFEVTKRENPDAILLAHGGPFDVPQNVAKLYEMTEAVGFVGASSIERIPIERAVLDAVAAFKSAPLPRRQKVGAAV